MGETTCLMQPFSYTAGISHQPKEGTPIHELGQSISFGRFTSESLAWEKWSTFSHNKYVEEAEKFSRPGSVAQMKAFFEAHYRNLAARKAAEEANAAAEATLYNDTPPSEHHEIVLGQIASEGSQEHFDGQVGIKETSPVVIIALDDRGHAKSSAEMGEEEDMETSLREVEPLSENRAVVDDCVEVESLSHFVCAEDEEEEVQELELSASRQMEQPLLKGFISNRDDKLGLVTAENEEDVKELELSGGSKQMEKPLLKQSFISNRDDDEMGSVSKRKSAASTLTPLVSSRTTKVLSSPAKPSSSASKPLINCRTTKVLSSSAKPPASTLKSLINSRTTKVPSSQAKPPASLSKALLNGRTTKVLPSPAIPSPSASKPLINGRTTKVLSSPAKPESLLCARKESSATPIRKRSTLEFLDKRKSTPKSMHKSMNFTPVREINRITSSIIRKIDSSRVASTTKSSKGCSTPLRATTIAVSMQLDPKQTSTPLTENGRASTPLHPLASGSKTSTPLHPLASGSKTNRAKWSFLPTECSNFLSSSKIRTESPVSTSPFGFRTEERVARRKKKLEEKFNADQAKIVQLQATLKEKAEAELKKLRRSLCFKARPLPDFYKERGSSRDQMEKIPLTTCPQSPRRTSPTTTQTAQPLLKSSVKSSCSKNVLIKHGKVPSFQTSRNTSRDLGENTSPNIRHYLAM